MKENICEDRIYMRNWANHRYGVEKLIYNSGSYATFIRENYGEVIHEKEVLVRCEFGSIDIDQYAKENRFTRIV
jgi:hypothetical protein